MKDETICFVMKLTMPDSLRQKIYEASESKGLTVSTIAREGFLMKLAQLGVELTPEDKSSKRRGWKPGRVRGARKHVTGRQKLKLEGGAK